VVSLCFSDPPISGSPICSLSRVKASAFGLFQINVISVHQYTQPSKQTNVTGQIQFTYTPHSRISAGLTLRLGADQVFIA